MEHIKKLLNEMVLEESITQHWDKYGDKIDVVLYYDELKMEWTPVKDFAVEGYIFNKLKPIVKELCEK